MRTDTTGDLFGSYAPRARRRDPETSKVAAERVKEFAANHHAIIVLCLKDHGPLTISEIEFHSGLEVHAVARRMVDLQRMGVIRVLTIDGIEQTRAGPSGRQQRVWVAV